VADVDGAATLTTNPVDPAAINGNVFNRLATGAFLDADIGLFFWNLTSGRNRAIDEEEVSPGQERSGVARTAHDLLNTSLRLTGAASTSSTSSTRATSSSDNAVTT
jgi:hypothetical protein